MRLNDESQVAVPTPVRDQLGSNPGSEVDFAVDESGDRHP